MLFSRTGAGFVGVVKFKFLAHLLVDHLADPVVPSLKFFLR